MSPLIPLSKLLTGIGIPALGAAGYTAYENLMAAKDRLQERERTPEDKAAAEDLEGAVNRYRERLIDQILGITRDTSDSARLALMGKDTNSLEATLANLKSEAMQGSPVRDLTPEQRQQLMELPPQSNPMGGPMRSEGFVRPAMPPVQEPLGQGVTENPGFDPQTGDFFPPQRAYGGIMSLRR